MFTMAVGLVVFWPSKEGIVCRKVTPRIACSCCELIAGPLNRRTPFRFPVKPFLEEGIPSKKTHSKYRTRMGSFVFFSGRLPLLPVLSQSQRGPRPKDAPSLPKFTIWLCPVIVPPKTQLGTLQRTNKQARKCSSKQADKQPPKQAIKQRNN